MKIQIVISAGLSLFSVMCLATSGVVHAQQTPAMLERERPGEPPKKPEPRPEPPPRSEPRPAPQPRPEPPRPAPQPRPEPPAQRPEPRPVQPAPQPRPEPPAPRPQPRPEPPAQRPQPPVVQPQPQPQPRPEPPRPIQPRPEPPAPRPQPPVVQPQPRPEPPHVSPRPQPPVVGPNNPGHPIPPPRPVTPPPAPRPGHVVGVVPTRPVQHIEPPRVVSYERPSHWSNPATQHNINYSTGLGNHYRTNYPTHVTRINNYGNVYYNNYNTIIVNRTVVINNYYNLPAYRYYYSGYYRHGFYGGYYYPVRPCYTIHTYFWYPTIYWMYVSAWDDDYYRIWYPNYRYRVEPFRYAMVYYPTDTLRDLGMEVSAMGEFEQYNFRQGLTSVSSQMEQMISEQLVSSYTLEANDIVVNHYQNLRDQAIVVEGFADRDNLHLAFKALIDLRNPSQTMVFMPMNQEPTQADLYALQNINQRIINLGGNPFEADLEPVKFDN